MKTNKKIIIFVYLFVSFVLTSAFCEEPPSKFPPCDTSLERQSWNNCYKKVTFGDGFKYHGEWNRGLFHGKGKFITAEGLIEEGEWIEGSLKWQSKYYYKRHLPGIWEVKTNSINEKIYFYGQWIGFLNLDHVCRILSTEPTFIRNKNAKNYGVKKSAFIILRTNCKDNKFKKSFDNIFITNEGSLVLFQTKIVSSSELTNPVLNSTFPDNVFYDSFERKELDFLLPKQITKNLTEEEFLSKFKHKFENLQ